ncbi:Protein VACUOLELESS GAMETOPHYTES [Cardamine amara subsp. amara]|uniref:Protein VACUOLELESS GAMETOPHYTES n=1 Tax=Cardamine amara subsp. amara TaxID=228776 RepID=A0ABD1AY27_CARAN
MEEIEVPFHLHPLRPFTRFDFSMCEGCRLSPDFIYGGYRCNELGCDTIVFHKKCVMPLPEINHSYHPDHPLYLIMPYTEASRCSQCAVMFTFGYFCSTCDFKLDLICARKPGPLVLPENSYIHEHPLTWRLENWYSCNQCDFSTSLDSLDLYPEANHPCHPQHPLKSLKYNAAPDYADKKCLLCATSLYYNTSHLHHCDVCNFSICRRCMKNPPPLGVVSLTTHEHQLHLVPRCIDFTCNACGTQGDRSPYFCLQCNFMIHRDCIDLPRVININRHDHRISYTRRLGHGEWKCGVCRKKVDGFYGAYSCSKCSTFAVHSRCAMRKDVWDMVELEGTPEETEEAAPFEVIDDNMIKHFSHDHNLRFNKDGRMLHESTLCQACVFQICSEPFYSCEQCDFILHQKCANLPRKKRHVCHNYPFTLQTDSLLKTSTCFICNQEFTGFRYKSNKHRVLDVRCGAISEPFEHRSHLHPLYYTKDVESSSCDGYDIDEFNCENFSCDECVFSLDYKRAILPQKVMRHRYDDHPLSLSYGESSVNGDYWCEACETKVNPEEWFYTCDDCGVILHISCVLGDFSYIMPGTCSKSFLAAAEVVPNTSICRPFCSECNSQCKLPSILQVSDARDVYYVCSFECISSFVRRFQNKFHLLSFILRRNIE